jgi:hypothetical protein
MLESNQSTPESGSCEIDDGLSEVGERLVPVLEPAPCAVHPNVGVLDDLFAQPDVIEQESGEADE